MTTRNTKEKIIESLEGKRAKQIWDLIEKFYLEVFEDTKKEDLEIAKEEYLSWEKGINDERNRYLLVEHYNLDENFYGDCYKDGIDLEEMYDSYFDNVRGCWEEVLIIDMQEKKCYVFDKEVKYIKQEVEIK